MSELYFPLRQMDGIAKAQERGARFGRKPKLLPDKIEQITELRRAGKTVLLS
jgi:DNA invertase Pin-like site-specific DNA recombinase